LEYLESVATLLSNPLEKSRRHRIGCHLFASVMSE
jgi:hypothetical protein